MRPGISQQLQVNVFSVGGEGKQQSLVCLQLGGFKAELGTWAVVCVPEASQVTPTKCPLKSPTLGHSREFLQVNESQAAAAKTSLNLQDWRLSPYLSVIHKCD